LLVTALPLALSGCGPEPLEFPDWVLPVAEGARIVEYAAVPIEERTERIELVEDLVISERGADPNYIFYRPRGVVADATGRIFVLDAGNSRVQVFDAEGEYVRTLGREGQGPGELSRPFGLAIAGNHLVVHDFSNGRFVVWSLEGKYTHDRRFEEGRGPSGLTGLRSGSLLGRNMVTQPSEQSQNFSLQHELAIFSQEAEIVRRLQRFPRFEPVAIQRAMPGGGVMTVSTSAPSPSAVFASTPDGEIYSGFSAEYQIHAFDEFGSARWALRIPWERLPFTQADIDETVADLREAIEDVDVSEVEWPEQYPAIEDLEVDGRGRLHVFPQFKSEGGDERPVDVYSRDGEHLFSGWISRKLWDYALDDFVYGRSTDQETGEVRIVRYRLIWPD
jgi:hypothetical protein